MWPRVVEIMLGCWLVLSPFIFGHSGERPAWWINDISCGTAIIILALVSHWNPLKRIHLVSAIVALWLIGFAYFSSPYPTPPAMQNDIVLGLLVAMFAILPSEVHQPPNSWRRLSGQGR